MDDDAPLGAVPGSRLRTGSEPIRRFEVLTGVGRRRTFAVEEKLALVAQMASTQAEAREAGPPRGTGGGGVEIDGVAVKVPRGADASVIAAVIDALKTR